MSLCDTCHEPGRCCRSIVLNHGDGEMTWWADNDPAEVLAEHIGEHWFVPIEAEKRSYQSGEGHTYHSGRWRCTALGEDGRCTVYERRPQLCRNYEPGSDGLCVYHTPAEQVA